MPSARDTLQDFVKFLIETGEGSLEVKFELPEREALQRAVQRLGPCVAVLIDMIEESAPEAERALLNLCRALASAYTIGSQGTISENTAVAVGSQRADAMREAKSKRRRESPANQIIKDAVERNRAGNEGRLYKVADIVVNEVQPVLKKQGHQLTDKQVRERAARMLKKPVL